MEKEHITTINGIKVYRLIEKVESIYTVTYTMDQWEDSDYMNDNDQWFLTDQAQVFMSVRDGNDMVYEIPLMVMPDA